MSRTRPQSATLLNPAAKPAPLIAPGNPDTPGFLKCPFAVIIDTREQLPYTFENIRANKDQGEKPIQVDTGRQTLPVGDYSIKGLPGFVIERKSKADLYQSVSQGRENFQGRLHKMACEYSFASVVVEAEWKELLTDPPPHTRFNPKSLARTIQTWMIRYRPVHWHFLWNRDAAESWAFRLMDAYWKAVERGEYYDMEIRLDAFSRLAAEGKIAGD